MQIPRHVLNDREITGARMQSATRSFDRSIGPQNERRARCTVTRRARPLCISIRSFNRRRHSRPPAARARARPVTSPLTLPTCATSILYIRFERELSQRVKFNGDGGYQRETGARARARALRANASNWVKKKPKGPGAKNPATGYEKEQGERRKGGRGGREERDFCVDGSWM